MVDTSKVKGGLLEPGWAGELTLAEARFIQERLLKDKRLRRLWGFKASRTRIPLGEVAARAFPENPTWARTHIEGLRERERRCPSLTKNTVISDTTEKRQGGGTAKESARPLPMGF